MSGLMIYETMRNSKGMVYHFQEQLKEALEDHCDTLNDEFEGKGVEWKFNNDKARMECHI